MPQAHLKTGVPRFVLNALSSILSVISCAALQFGQLQFVSEKVRNPTVFPFSVNFAVILGSFRVLGLIIVIRSLFC